MEFGRDLNDGSWRTDAEWRLRDDGSSPLEAEVIDLTDGDVACVIGLSIESSWILRFVSSFSRTEIDWGLDADVGAATSKLLSTNCLLTNEYFFFSSHSHTVSNGRDLDNAIPSSSYTEVWSLNETKQRLDIAWFGWYIVVALASTQTTGIADSDEIVSFGNDWRSVRSPLQDKAPCCWHLEINVIINWQPPYSNTTISQLPTNMESPSLSGSLGNTLWPSINDSAGSDMTIKRIDGQWFI